MTETLAPNRIDTLEPESERELVVVSNRLPVRVTLEGGVGVERTAGGLATALSGVDGVESWVGWPGTPIPADLRTEVEERLAAESLYPVFLDADDERDFYGRICNDTLWPLFHYFPDRLRITGEAWVRYEEVNQRFAEALALQAGPGARVWVHDFHLMLVPELLRRLRPDVAIGFFLHIPFPSSEVYRLLPTREKVLRGLLGADYVSFHTGEYARHFRSACLRVLGVESEPDAIEIDGRRVGIGVDPIGIDTEGFRESLTEPRAVDLAEVLEERYRGRRLVLGVERLDYTKGIPQKLRAFERFLEENPERARATTLLQVLVPSRLDSVEYRAQRDEIELLIARINGRFGQPGMTPVEYMNRNVGRTELAALYRRADAMLVTPLRDGMNLVAHEFALCQAAEGAGESHRGALVLSEFAGAARVLPGALLVNPWDIEDTVLRLSEALELPDEERRRRLDTIATRVDDLDCRRWAARFLSRLDEHAAAERCRPAQNALEPAARRSLRRRFGSARRRTLLLDYDGTLRELEDLPELAAPTREIRELLASLAALPDTEVHIVSGRPPETLDAWFGDLALHLSAEHGFLARAPGELWRTLVDADLSWLPEVERFLRETAAEVPGAVVEQKRCGVAWHYRQAEPEYGLWRARDLLVALGQRLAGTPAEVLPGNRVVEVRARGVDKGVYVRRLFPAGREPGLFVLCAGDDRTDRQMLDALPMGAAGIHVGPLSADLQSPGNCVAYTLDSPAAVRSLLHELLETDL
jgi:trehalose 6-phosphate synthase/phosphatase